MKDEYKVISLTCEVCDRIVCFVKCHLTGEALWETLSQEVWGTDLKCYEKRKSGVKGCCYCWRARKRRVVSL